MEDQLKKITNFLLKNSEDGLENVLEDIFTPEEIKNIYERIMILEKLKEWFTQREITKMIWVSIGTVSRGSRIIQYGKKKGNFKF